MNDFFVFTALLSYPLSIFIDASAYNLKRLLKKGAEARYWLSVIYIYQYTARVFMVVFIPSMSLSTENFGDFNFISVIIISIQLATALILIVSAIKLRIVDNLAMRVLAFLAYFTGKNNIDKSFDRSRELAVKSTLSAVFSNKLFYMSFLSQALVGFSMTFIYVFSFYYPNNILFLNSVTQILNMFAVSILLIFIDPYVMGKFDSIGSGKEELLLIYVSRGLAHMFVGIMFISVYILR